jgi:CRISPR-associated protein (TIGR03986 family)
MNKANAQVHAPYNFAPYPNKVPPPWRTKTYIDVPFEDGVCGEIQFELTNSTPLMIGGEYIDGQPISFYSIDGKPVIPGSSIRGMLRNVAEIVSFSKFQHFNDAYPTLRDTSDLFYINQLGIKKSNKSIKAGWLTFDQESKSYRLLPCQFARMHIAEIEKGLGCSRLKKQSDAAEKYEITKSFCPVIGFNEGGKNQRGETIAVFGTEQEGRVVFTGEGENKVKEYIFYSDANNSISIPLATVQAFHTIYGKGGTENSSLAKLKALLKKATGVKGLPVFYTLNKDNEVAYLGLSKMIKLPPKHSVKDLRLPYPSSDSNLDIAELLFGCVADEDDSQSHALKSRLSVADMRHLKGERVEKPISVVLQQPSASYFPAYLQQSEGNTENKLSRRQVNYHTEEKARLRGFKRYPVQKNVDLQPAEPAQSDEESKSEDTNENIRKNILPLKVGATFSGKIRFHNLHPREIQLLCWLLTWGGDESLSHNLGMAKPYGYGAVKTKITAMHLEENKHPGQWKDCTLEVVPKAAAFEKWMESATQNSWKNSDTIKELLAMAKGIDSHNEKIKYMTLKKHTSSKAKDVGKNRSLGHALPAFTRLFEKELK